MRLAIVCYPTHGGSGVIATELAILLADRGHQVHLVSYELPFRVDHWRPNLQFHQVDVGEYPLFRYPPYTLNLTNKLIEIVEKDKVEIIHSHYAIPHAHAAWLAREVLRESKGIDVKLACTLHGTDITLVGRQPAYHELTKFVMKHQDLLTAPSEWLAKETAEHFAIAKPSVKVIPNFVDLDRFRPADATATRACLAPEGQRIITHASNFRPVKRIEDVVKAFAVLRKSIPAVLALVGDGPDLPAAENLARELGVFGDLRMLGQLEHIEPILQASDLFLLPSRAESFGLAALEAMACGCPVLGYRAGGLPEVVIDGKTGILCEEGKDVCLGSVAATLLQDQPRYEAMRKAARVQAERFATRPMADRYEHELSGLLKKAAKS